jgi:hypothetical protein
MKCPFCTLTFSTASGVTIHLESGTCASGIDRHQINTAIRNLDRDHHVTRPMLTLPGYDNIESFATERAFNGSAYECYLCSRAFRTLYSLNAHLQSPVHEQNLYHCPKPSCRREFKLLSSLIAHFESESCGLFRFAHVQQQAKHGVEAMVGRMIRG